MESSATNESASKKRNAFSELMNPRPKIPKATRAPNLTSSSSTTTTTTTTTSETAENIPASRRDGLGTYIANPTAFPSTVVISHNPDYVTIHDLYPKSSIHLLVLPRNQAKSHLHPFEALDGSDVGFLTSVRVECAKARSLAASELRRRFGKFSAQDQAREAALSADPAPESLPPGRDWSAEIMVGVHAVPSMSHLHIHVISVDRRSDKLKHRKHYNSFSTPFFVPLEDFPLADEDDRRWPGRERYLKRDFRCWRCGRGFGKGFKRLKEHLEEEFEDWKKQ